VRAAIRTDFVLSAEIIVITLGTVAGQPLTTQIGVLTGIAALMTAGVYGLVAGIVRLDDIGLYLSRSSDGRQRRLGRAILAGAPHLMRILSVVGTAAMFLVGGGILTHGFPGAHEAIDQLASPQRIFRCSGTCSGRWRLWSPTGLLGSSRARPCLERTGWPALCWLRSGSDARAARLGIDRERGGSPMSLR
jgi:predicted DNA repair protein MutK